MASFNLNHQQQTATGRRRRQMPLLWVIRDFVGLKAPSSDAAFHNAAPAQCTWMAAPSLLQFSCIGGLPVKKLPLLKHSETWIMQCKKLDRNQVPQCGYCQSGQIMSALALLKKNPKPSDADIDTAMQGNICRCGTYQRVRKAHIAQPS